MSDVYNLVKQTVPNFGVTSLLFLDCPAICLADIRTKFDFDQMQPLFDWIKTASKHPFVKGGQWINDPHTLDNPDGTIAKYRIYFDKYENQEPIQP